YGRAVGRVLNPALTNFNQGVRGYYFALAAAAWLYQLYALVAAIAVVGVLAGRWRDRARIGETAVAAGTAMVLVAPWLGPCLVEWLAAG
ncbi:DUF599 family protein, partial [Bacillus safensis]|uniref:DUF599 family protein n=1 Tax=Bacillus safensis TaxID=561879 RepID=UPI002DD43A27